MKTRAVSYAMLLCWILGFAPMCGDAAEKPLNVLFIAIDDLRPELASYKTDGIRTPNIDRLAAKGLQFNAAYCDRSRPTSRLA